MFEDLQALVSTCPSEVTFLGKTYNPDKREALSTFKKNGCLDLYRLIDEEKMPLLDTPVTREWFKVEGKNSIFTGQVKNGKPHGLVRILQGNGGFDEGFFRDDFSREGFCRTVFTDGDH